MRIFGADYGQAMHHFERAAEIDSTFLSPRIFLVYAYSSQGRQNEADSLLLLLKQGHHRLTPYQRLYMEFVEALLHRSHAECMRFLRQLERRTPDANDVNYLIGLTAIRMNRPQEAVDAYAEFDIPKDLGTFAFGWWRFDKWADALHLLGRYREELEILNRAREVYPDVRYLRVKELRAVVALGRVDEAQRIIDECMTVSDDFSFQCDVFGQAAIELRAHGHLDAALRLADRAVALYEDLSGMEVATEDDRYAAADMLYCVERWEEAGALFKALAAEKPDDVSYMGYLGCLAARKGDREDALRVSTQLRQTNQPHLYGSHTYCRACIAAQLGERERAVELLREALAQGHPYGLWLHNDLDLDPLRDYPPFQELLRPKG